MKRKHVRKVLSVCMVLILLLSTTAAVSVSGGEVAADDEALLVTDIGTATAEDSTFFVGELVEKRDQFEKHYRLEDGSYTAVIYDSPVHYQDDSNGEWVEIDNTLEVGITTDGTAVYRNRDGLFNVAFAQTVGSDSGQLVTVENEGHTLSWRFVAPLVGAVANETAQLDAVGEAVATSPATVTAQLLTTEADTADLTAVPSTGALVYDDLAGQNADVRFTVTSTRVKEDILLTTAPAQAVSYTTELTLSDGLVPTLHEDGTVFIRDAEENEVFRIVAPYMTDAADELSWEVAVELEQNEDVWMLTVTPDLEWLQNKARVYPVTIDPTVTTSAANNAANVWDTYIYEGSISSGGVARQDLDRMYIGNRTSTEQKCRGLLKFLTMPQIWGDITSATLTLSTPSGTTSWKNMRLYRITSSWESSTVAWPGPNVSMIQSKAVSNGQYVFDVTGVLKNMYKNNVSGTNGNYGFEIRYQDETAADYNAIRSSEWSDDTLISPSKPYLVINYTEYEAYPTIMSDRYYVIKNVASGKLLHVPNFGAAGMPPMESSANYLANQAWKLYYEGNGVYSVIPAYNTGLRLNVPNFISADGQNLSVWTSNATTAQRWYIRSNGDGSFRFIPYCAKDDNRVMQIEDPGTTPTAELSVWNNTAKQKWYIQRVSSPQCTTLTRKGIYYVKNKSTGKYLGVSTDAYTVPATVGQYAKTQNGTQRWLLGYNERNHSLLPTLGHNGVFTQNQAMEVKNNTVDAGGTIQIASSSGLDQQTFQVKQTSAGTYVLLTACSGYNMALTAGSGSTVTTSAYSATTGATDAQQWIFESGGDRTLTAVSIGGEFFLEKDGYTGDSLNADIKLSQRAFDLLGYATERYDTPDYDTIYTEPDLASVVHFSCHGGPDVLQFQNALGRNSGSGVNVTIDYYDANTLMQINQYVTDNCKLMIFDACSTYLPGADNDICDAAVADGVDAVLAWGHDIPVNNLSWFEDFYDYLLRGKTITEAVELMNKVHIDTDGDGSCNCRLECDMHDAVIVGNGNFRLYAQS